MFELSNLIYILSGVTAGTFAGLIPGVGVLTSLLIFYPFLYQAEIIHLLLFYVALAGTVQFTGTIPSVLIGVPGENNSIPAVIEGNKFRRRNRSAMAIGICALGSLFGSVLSVGIFLLISNYALNAVSMAVSNNFKLLLYIFVLVCLVMMYNGKSVWKNILLLGFGVLLGSVGESDINNNYRFTFGTLDLEHGLGVLPVISGLLIIPIVLSTLPKLDARRINFTPSFFEPLITFYRNIWSSVRGSILGIIGGLVPGASTIISTNLSHTVERTLNPRSPMKKIIAAETANNSGQFASLIPLLLLGIPITGSEVLLFNMLTNLGWDLNSTTLSLNTKSMIQDILPWFVVVNLLALMISWPLAKHSMVLFKLPNWLLTSAIVVILVSINIYVGHTDHRMMSYIYQLIVFTAVGSALKRYDMIPTLFGFLLSNELEAVTYRFFALH